MGSKNKKNRKGQQKNSVAVGTTAEVSGNRVYGRGNKVITDERFSLSQKDPRFQDVPKHKTKVAIDSRFSRMFTDKKFSNSSARVDKRGRARKDGDSAQNAFKHYYRIDEGEVEVEEEKEKKQKKQLEELESESDSDDDVDVESEEEHEESESDDVEKSKKVGGRIEIESESSEGEEDDGDEIMDDWTSTDSDEEDEAYSEEEETNALLEEENVPEIEEETHRLAVVNLDWNQVQAVDLFVVLSSFLPKTGQILSVSVYPSEFGLKRMEEEAVHGPVGLFDDEDRKNKKDDDSDEDDDDEIDNEKLRAYELSRLRYYFAVVVCDSIGTADYLYKTCDGIEFERSSNKLDLRFIPDSMEFKHPARDVATEAPTNYEGVDFQTRALQLCKLELTWDENEPRRSKKLKRKINANQESEYVKDEEDLKEFIASSESETDEDENDADAGNGPGKRHKTDAYRALLQSDGDGSEGKEEDDGVDMEVTFNTGLEDLSKKILEKKDKKSETVWEAYLRKKKEKKKTRKNRSKNSSDDESDSDREPVDEPGDFFNEEPAVKEKGDRNRKAQGRKLAKEAEEASRAELELLLADDDGADANLKGYNLKHNKAKGKKGKREAIDEEKIPTIDYDDLRFSSLFTRPDFALDPTDPQFKRSAAYARQVAQKQHKIDSDDNQRQEDNNLPGGAQTSDGTMKTGKDVDAVNSKKDKHEIAMLLKSVKMKSKQIPLPSNGVKKSGRRAK